MKRTVKTLIFATATATLSFSALSAEIKNVILMIGDGMGPQQVGLLETYANNAPHSIYNGETTALYKLAQEGVIGSSLTHPEEAPFATVIIRVPSDKLRETIDYFRDLAIKVSSEKPSKPFPYSFSNISGIISSGNNSSFFSLKSFVFSSTKDFLSTGAGGSSKEKPIFV